jgi:hypothetical protein
MFRVLFLLAAVEIFAFAAQYSGPDYSIRNIRSSYSADGRQFIVQFEVWNIGEKTTRFSTATLTAVTSGQQVAVETVPALEAQEIHTVTLAFPTDLFEPGSQELFRAAVGVNEVETEGSDGIQDNFAQITITFPDIVLLSEATVEPDDQNIEGKNPDILSEFIEPIRNRIASVNPAQIPILTAIIGAVILILVLLLLILRLLFDRRQDLGNWDPPYINTFSLDPNTLSGRRQQWQMHAQNSSLPVFESRESQFHVRKWLTDIEENYLSGWRITGVRVSQYDMYGRVNRSQIVASRGQVKRLERLIQKRTSLTPEQLQERLRPISKGLVAKLNKKINERNAVLPVALDIRLTGRHGDVRIWFELFRSQSGQWTRIDRWEPEMTVAGKTIDESFTYTMHGSRPRESRKMYRERLQNDLAKMVIELLLPLPQNSSPAQRSTAPTDPHLNTVYPSAQ